MKTVIPKPAALLAAAVALLALPVLSHAASLNKTSAVQSDGNVISVTMPLTALAQNDTQPVTAETGDQLLAATPFDAPFFSIDISTAQPLFETGGLNAPDAVLCDLSTGQMAITSAVNVFVTGMSRNPAMDGPELLAAANGAIDARTEGFNDLADNKIDAMIAASLSQLQ